MVYVSNGIDTAQISLWFVLSMVLIRLKFRSDLLSMVLIRLKFRSGLWYQWYPSGSNLEVVYSIKGIDPTQI